MIMMSDISHKTPHTKDTHTVCSVLQVLQLFMLMMTMTVIFSNLLKWHYGEVHNLCIKNTTIISRRYDRNGKVAIHRVTKYYIFGNASAAVHSIKGYSASLVCHCRDIQRLSAVHTACQISQTADPSDTTCT